MTHNPTPVAAMRSVADVLNAAADLIEPKGSWTQGAYARSFNGKDLNPQEKWRATPEAASRCMYGAVAEIAAPRRLGLVPPSGSWGLPSTEWNDDPERTQAEVVAALRKAAALSRASEGNGGA